MPIGVVRPVMGQPLVPLFHPYGESIMEEEKKSPIESVSVELGTSPAGAEAAKVADTGWVFLICTDLGYLSETIRPVTSADLGRFMDESGACARGTVDRADGDGRVFVEYPVRAPSDFSGRKLAECLPAVAGERAVSAALEAAAKGEISPQRAVEQVQPYRSEIPEAAEGIRLLQGAAGAEKGAVDTASSAVDNILSAMDTGPSSSASTEGSTAAARERLGACVASLRNRIDTRVRLVREAGFFSDLRASWSALRHAVKLAGRNRDITLLVYSAPRETCAEMLPGILRKLTAEGVRPDSVLWDHDVTLNNADISLMTSLAQSAEAAYTTLLAGLAPDDPFVRGCDGADTLRPLFEDPSFQILARLRTTTASRLLTLAAPRVVIDAREEPPCRVAASWLILFNLITRIKQGGAAPLRESVTLDEAELGAAAEFPLRDAARLTADLSEEAGEKGLTLLSRTTASRAGTPVRTLIDESVASSQYTLLAYNLLVNRLAGEVLGAARDVRSGGGERDSVDEVTRRIEALLARMRMIKRREEVDVREEGGTVSVDIDPSGTIGGLSARVKFDLDLDAI